MCSCPSFVPLLDALSCPLLSHFSVIKWQKINLVEKEKKKLIVFYLCWYFCIESAQQNIWWAVERLQGRVEGTWERRGQDNCHPSLLVWERGGEGGLPPLVLVSCSLCSATHPLCVTSFLVIWWQAAGPWSACVLLPLSHSVRFACHMGSVTRTMGESKVVVMGKGNPAPLHPLPTQMHVLLSIVMNTKWGLAQ